MEAAVNGDADLVELFLDYGADTIKVMNNGVTAQAAARIGGHNEIAELLSASDQ